MPDSNDQSEPTVEIAVDMSGEEVILSENNTTVYRFREAKHMDHIYVVREDGYTVVFGCEPLIRQLIDNDFPLQTARWPRQVDFDAFEHYIDKLAEGLRNELEGMDDAS